MSLFRNLAGPLTALFASGAILAAALPALADDAVFSGRLVHVSFDNIKVRSRQGEVLSFLIVPRFRKIFGSDGKTTVQLQDLRDGDRVRVYYDQKALGARHANRIVDETAPLTALHS
jgi:hypothetical protein